MEPGCHHYSEEDYAADAAAAQEQTRSPGLPRPASVVLWYPGALTTVTMVAQGSYHHGYPEGAVIHSTFGRYGSEQDLINTMREGAKNRLAYFGISADGKIYQSLPLDQWGSHAGVTYHPVLGGGLSRRLVGIEVASPGLLTKTARGYETYWGEVIPEERVRYQERVGNVTCAGYYARYTEAQEQALNDLLLWLHRNYSQVFKLENIVGHDEVAVSGPKRVLGRKQDPGGGLSWLMDDYRCTLMGASPTRRSVAQAAPAPVDPYYWSWFHFMATCSKAAYRENAVAETVFKRVLGAQEAEPIEVEHIKLWVTVNEAYVVVAFRGTQSLAEWMTDLDVFGTEESSMGPVHPGFYKAYKLIEAPLKAALRRHLSPEKQLWFTGHSLGGALATLAAAEYPNPDEVSGICTFGQPRVGFDEFQEKFNRHYANKCFRVVNNADLASRLPPPGFALHVGQLLWFDATGKVNTQAPEAVRRGRSVEPPAMSGVEFEEVRAQLQAMQNAAVDLRRGGVVPPEPVKEERIELLRGVGMVGDHDIDRYIALARQESGAAELPVAGEPETRALRYQPLTSVRKASPESGADEFSWTSTVRELTKAEKSAAQGRRKIAVANDLAPTQPPLAVHVLFSEHSAAQCGCGYYASAICDFLGQKPIHWPLDEDQDPPAKGKLSFEDAVLGIPVFAGHHYDKVRKLIDELRLPKNADRRIQVIVFTHSSGEGDGDFKTFYDAMIEVMREKNAEEGLAEKKLANVRIFPIPLDQFTLSESKYPVTDVAVDKEGQVRNWEDRKEAILMRVAGDLAQFLDKARARIFLSYARSDDNKHATEDGLAESLICVQFEGPEHEIKTALLDLPDVKSVRTKHDYDNWWTYRIHVRGRAFLEDEIYQLSKKWKIRHLSTKRLSEEAQFAKKLEALFRGNRLSTFLDVLHVEEGKDLGPQLKAAAQRSLLVSLRGDAYSQSPYCLQELKDAKLAGVPVISLLLLKRGERRSSVHGGNCYTIPRANHDDIERIGLICLQALLQHIYFHQVAPLLLETWELTSDGEPALLTRPPELVDCTPGGVVVDPDRPSVLFHSDPPLSKDDAEAFSKTFGNVTLATPTSIHARIRAGLDVSPFEGLRVAVSLSDGPELNTVLDLRDWEYPKDESGFPIIDRETALFRGNPESGVLLDQVDDAVAYIVVTLLRGGARIGYGGHPAGYTLLFNQIIKAYARSTQTPDRLITCYVAAQFNPDKTMVRVAARKDGQKATTYQDKAREYSAMRVLMAEECRARVVMGGKFTPAPGLELVVQEMEKLADLPTQGKETTYVGRLKEDGTLHIRTFDASGNPAINVSETMLLRKLQERANNPKNYGPKKMEDEAALKKAQNRFALLRDALPVSGRVKDPELIIAIFDLLKDVTGAPLPGFLGRFPGHAEEVYQHLHRREFGPIYILGGFEGTTGMIVKALKGGHGKFTKEAELRRQNPVYDALCEGFAVPDLEDAAGKAVSPLEKYGLPSSLDAMWEQIANWGAGYFHSVPPGKNVDDELWKIGDRVVNGLTVRENLILFESTQPYQISTLISFGMQKWLDLVDQTALEPLQVRAFGGSITDVPGVDAYAVPVNNSNRLQGADGDLNIVMGGALKEHLQGSTPYRPCRIGRTHLPGKHVFPHVDTTYAKRTDSLSPDDRKNTALEAIRDAMLELVEKAAPLGVGSMAIVPFFANQDLEIKDSVRAILTNLLEARKHARGPLKALTICEINPGRFHRVKEAMEELAKDPEWKDKFAWDPAGPPAITGTRPLPERPSVMLTVQNVAPGKKKGAIQRALHRNRTSFHRKVLPFDWEKLLRMLYPPERQGAAPSIEQQKEIAKYLGEFLIPDGDRIPLLEDPRPLDAIHDIDCSAIPFELLGIEDGGRMRFLCEIAGVRRSLITDNPPATDYLRTGSLRRMLLVGDPTSELDNALTEVDRIESALRTLTDLTIVKVKGPEATLEKVLKLLEGIKTEENGEPKGFDFLHFAGHGFFDSGNPERSGLIFRRANEAKDLEAIHFTGEVLRQAKFPHPPAFVFLNACEVGRMATNPRPIAGSLASIILSSGISGFVSNQWEVGDKSASDFAISLYKDLLNREPLGKAVLNARKSLLDRPIPHHDWANYVFYGNPDLTI